MEGETGTDAGAGLQVSVPAKGNTKVAVSRMRTQGSEPSQPSGVQGDPSAVPGVHVYDQRTLNHLQVLNQHNIDPETLERIVQGYVQSQLNHAEQVIQHERQQHQLKQQNAALQLSLEHQQMNQHIQQQEASMAQQAHSRINQITTEAQAEILKHQQIAEQAQREIQRVTAAAEARCQDLARENEALRASPVAGYFDACPSEAGRAPSVASASPLNVVYCHVCGNQNVVGRGWCRNCKSSLEEPENGTDPFEPPSHERYMYPEPTRPSTFAEVPLPRAPGGPGPYGMPCGALHDGSHVHHLGVDPRLVYGISTPKAVSESGSAPVPGVGFQRAVPAMPSFPRASMGPAYPPGGYIGTIPEAPPGVSSSSHPPAISRSGLPQGHVHAIMRAPYTCRFCKSLDTRGCMIVLSACNTSQEGVIGVWWWIRELGWFIR